MPAGVTYTSSKLEALCKQGDVENRVRRDCTGMKVNQGINGCNLAGRQHGKVIGRVKGQS